MPEGYSELNLGTMNSGAANEIFNRELDAVMNNIADVNTRAKEPRKITLEFTITPNEDRNIATLEIKGKTKISSLKPIEMAVAFQKQANGSLKPFENELKQPDFNFDNVTNMKEQTND